jgi:hypothetical protein
MPLPSFNYAAINAPGGIAAGLGGLSAALVQAPQEKRRLALAEQAANDRRANDEQDQLMRQQAMDDRHHSAEVAAQNDARDFEYKKTNDQRNYELASQNSATLGAERVGNAVHNFQTGGGLMGLLAGKPPTGAGHAPNPNADLIPDYLLKDVESRVGEKVKAMQKSMNNAGGITGALNQQQVSPGVIEDMRQNEFKALGYSPVTKRRLGPGTMNAAGQPASPQQMPTPSDQPSQAPNQSPDSDADILKLKQQHPQYATIPDDEFIRRVRAKRQGK